MNTIQTAQKLSEDLEPREQPSDRRMHAIQKDEALLLKENRSDPALHKSVDAINSDLKHHGWRSAHGGAVLIHYHLTHSVFTRGQLGTFLDSHKHRPQDTIQAVYAQDNGADRPCHSYVDKVFKHIGLTPVLHRRTSSNASDLTLIPSAWVVRNHDGRTYRYANAEDALHLVTGLIEAQYMIIF